MNELPGPGDLPQDVPIPDVPPSPAPAPPRGPLPLRAGPLVLVVALAALIGFGGGIAGLWGLGRLAGGLGGTSTPAGLPAVIGGQGGNDSGTTGSNGASADALTVAGKVEAAIVDINTVTETGGGSGQAAATGLILTSSGEILTNNHVVDGATSISVTIPGHSRDYTAQVAGVDPAADIALIKIEGVSGLPTVKLADSSALQVGQSVVAIGNAGGQGGAPSVTQGTITGLDQTITASDFGANAEQLTGMIETSANIQPGDSGGALVDTRGEVVGVITAGQVQQFRFRFGSAGLGYAVPSNKAQDVVRQVRSGKASGGIIIGQAGYIGVTVSELDTGTASRLNVSAGVLVGSVQPGSSAESAGLAAGDVITAVDGTSVDSIDALSALIHTRKPGSRVQLTWVDDNGSHRATVTLVSGPAV